VCYPDGVADAVSQIGTFGERADGRWVDEHGCVQPNCEEGWECAPHPGLYRCAPDDAKPGTFGCVTIRCDEPGAADCGINGNPNLICFPTAPTGIVNVYGCAPKTCTNGSPCAADEACDPQNPAHDQFSCVKKACAADPTKCVVTPVPVTAQPSSTPSQPLASTGQACGVDTECACGACVLGRCEPTAGSCR
jgi:hypothetical protein